MERKGLDVAPSCSECRVRRARTAASARSFRPPLPTTLSLSLHPPARSFVGLVCGCATQDKRAVRRRRRRGHFFTKTRTLRSSDRSYRAHRSGLQSVAARGIVCAKGRRDKQGMNAKCATRGELRGCLSAVCRRGRGFASLVTICRCASVSVRSVRSVVETRAGSTRQRVGCAS